MFNTHLVVIGPDHVRRFMNQSKDFSERFFSLIAVQKLHFKENNVALPASLRWDTEILTNMVITKGLEQIPAGRCMLKQVIPMLLNGNEHF